MTDESPIRVEIEPGSLRKLIQASRTWDTVSRREMRAGLRAAAQPALDAARADVLGPPPDKADQSGKVAKFFGHHSFSTGRTSTAGNLRGGLAAGTSISIRTGRESGGVVKGEGVRVAATANKLPGAEAPMVKAYMASTFRHPVFGGPGYANQHGKNWFFAPLQAGRAAYQAAIVAAIDKASEAIAKD